MREESRKMKLDEQLKNLDAEKVAAEDARIKAEPIGRPAPLRSNLASRSFWIVKPKR